MFKFKIGTRLKKPEHINIEVIGFNEEDNTYKLRSIQDNEYIFTLSKSFLEEQGWVSMNPIWLYQSDSKVTGMEN